MQSSIDRGPLTKPSRLPQAEWPREITSLPVRSWRTWALWNGPFPEGSASKSQSPAPAAYESPTRAM